MGGIVTLERSRKGRMVLLSLPKGEWCTVDEMAQRMDRSPKDMCAWLRVLELSGFLKREKVAKEWSYSRTQKQIPGLESEWAGNHRFRIQQNGGVYKR